jgi:hypothetical protein
MSIDELEACWKIKIKAKENINNPRISYATAKN